jgi:hypothetical protein
MQWNNRRVQRDSASAIARFAIRKRTTAAALNEVTTQVNKRLETNMVCIGMGILRPLIQMISDQSLFLHLVVEPNVIRRLIATA